MEATELEGYIARMYDETREFVTTHRFGRPGGEDSDDEAAPDQD